MILRRKPFLFRLGVPSGGDADPHVDHAGGDIAVLAAGEVKGLPLLLEISKGGCVNLRTRHSSYWDQRRDRNCTQIFNTTLKYL